MHTSIFLFFQVYPTPQPQTVLPNVPGEGSHNAFSGYPGMPPAYNNPGAYPTPPPNFDQLYAPQKPARQPGLSGPKPSAPSPKGTTGLNHLNCLLIG